MNSAAGTVSTSPFIAEADEMSTITSLAFEREVHRLADALVPRFSGSGSCCTLLLDLGDAGTSSLWLASAVGSALGAALKTPVHVLSTESAASRDPRSLAGTNAWRGCVLEHFDVAGEATAGGSLVEHIAELRGAKHPVLLHAAKEDVLPEGLLQAGAVDGVVLLARASRTRRAALQAMVQRFTLAGVPLLGCVLLDRTHPIPEKLYHLL